jgi:large subunit ribosomal protein L29
VKRNELVALRELDKEALDARETKLREDLQSLRFKNSLGQLKNVMEIRRTKKDIAQIKTVTREKLAQAAKSSVSEG